MKKELTPFQCTSCGACCKLVYLQRWFREHNMLRPDGACKHLTAENRCAIYSERPAICRMNGIYEKARLVQIMPIEMWHDNVIEHTCRRAVFATGTDPAMIPKKHHDHAEMGRRVSDYLSSIECDPHINLPSPEVNFRFPSAPVPPIKLYE